VPEQGRRGVPEQGQVRPKLIKFVPPGESDLAGLPNEQVEKISVDSIEMVRA
jgi:hypothetical protein